MAHALVPNRRALADTYIEMRVRTGNSWNYNSQNTLEKDSISQKASRKLRPGTAVFWKARGGAYLVAWSVSGGEERPPGVVSELEKWSVCKVSDATLQDLRCPESRFSAAWASRPVSA